MRHRFQYNLSVLFLLISGIAVFLGWEVSALHNKQQAISAVEALGGTVTYDYQWSEKQHWNAKAIPPGPAWLRRMFGQNVRADVVEIQLFADNRQNSQGFTDVEARHLAVLNELKWLVLQDTKLTDEGLAHFQALTKLERLDIEGSLVTENGVEKLEAALPNLRVFY